MSSFKFNVSLNKRRIDSVWHDVSGCQNIAEMESLVRDCLVNHDGYSPDIKVKIGERVTETEYVLQGYYAHGFEDLCAESKYSEAKKRKREYQENEGGSYRIVTRRVKKY